MLGEVMKIKIIKYLIVIVPICTILCTLLYNNRTFIFPEESNVINNVISEEYTVIREYGRCSVVKVEDEEDKYFFISPKSSVEIDFKDIQWLDDYE